MLYKIISAVIGWLLVLTGYCMAFTLTSTAFQEAAAIPVRFSCDGADLSPALSWDAPPNNTQSFALICDDPDAPGKIWVHWVIYNISKSAKGLVEAVVPEKSLPDGTRQGINDFGRIGYGGPCPPKGAPHRYVFTLYALDTVLILDSGATKEALLRAMEGHVLSQTKLMGTYKR